MLRWLLCLKILGGNDRNLFLWFFVAHLEHLKDLCFVLPLSFKEIDVGLDRRRGLCGRGCSCGLGLGRAYSLRARVSSGWSVSDVVALVGTVAFLPATEAESFLDAPSSLRGG